MPVLLTLIGIIAAISVWYWRAQAAARAARDARELAKTATNLPRRLSFQYKASKGGLKLVEDPREAAAIIMLEIARAAGEVSAEHKQVMHESMRTEFEVSEEDATALVTHAAWLTRNAPAPHAVISRMADKILNTPGIGPKQIVDLDGILVAVSEAEGTPKPDQLALLQTFRDKVGLVT